MMRRRHFLRMFRIAMQEAGKATRVLLPDNVRAQRAVSNVFSASNDACRRAPCRHRLRRYRPPP
jgi:hypothetical protein